MQIWAHGSTVLGVGTSAPRAPLDKAVIASLTSQYWRVSVVDLTTSTQSDLADLVKSNSAKTGDVITTEFQSGGRGRLDRTFEAPPGSALLFSLYLAPKRVRTDWGFISHLAALSMQQVISRDLPSQVWLKWPNDILVGGAKVAGLLAQATDHGVIIGIGVNVAMTTEELPVDTATSLAITGSNNLDRNLILGSFLNCFESNFKEWDNGVDFVASYSEVCATLGRQVQVEVIGRENRTGLALSINSLGALMLADGFEVNVGDLVHLR
jgi:BirA family biotin operon repressor/biotin-[acetyl-CoA-carboxylase] ligase